MSEKETNEFSEFSDDDFKEEVNNAPNTEVEDDSDDSMYSDTGSSVKVNFDDIPDREAVVPRKDMDGEIVRIVKGDVLLPPISREWTKSKNGKYEHKGCTFRVYYESENPEYKDQSESYSGVRVFKADDGKYGYPSIYNDGSTQAKNLKLLYAKFKDRDINAIQDKEFFKAIDSGLLWGRLKTKEFEYNNKITKKNILVQLFSEKPKIEKEEK